jgi:hypothetical protein
MTPLSSHELTASDAITVDQLETEQNCAKLLLIRSVSVSLSAAAVANTIGRVTQSPELIPVVVGFLVGPPWKDSRGALGAVARVCRLWRDVAFGMDGAWTAIREDVLPTVGVLGGQALTVRRWGRGGCVGGRGGLRPCRRDQLELGAVVDVWKV